MKKLVSLLLVLSLCPALALADKMKDASALCLESSGRFKNAARTCNSLPDSFDEALLNQTSLERRKWPGQREEYLAIVQSKKEVAMKVFISAYPTQAGAFLDATAMLLKSLADLKVSSAEPSQVEQSYRAVFEALDKLGTSLESIPDNKLRRDIKEVVDVKYLVKAHKRRYSLRELSSHIIKFLQNNSNEAVSLSVGNNYFAPFRGKEREVDVK